MLTKADTVQSGDHEHWLDILRNKAHRLTHGYYVTRQLSPEQIRQNLLWKESRDAECRFFETQKPWCDEEIDRLGTEKLTQALSMRLSNVIDERYFSISSGSSNIKSTGFKRNLIYKAKTCRNGA